MTTKLSDFNPALLRESDEAIEVFLADAIETGDAGHIASAIGVIARAKGMIKFSRQTGLAREQLHKALITKGNPTLATTPAVLKALGYGLNGKKLVA